jgi:hypothetical protein
MALPTRAQLRFLLDLVAAGGEGYGAAMTRNPRTITTCRTARWVEYLPVPDEPFEIGKHYITDIGRRVAMDASPAVYAARLAQAGPALITPLAGVTADAIDAAIDGLTEDHWEVLEPGYIDGVSQHIGDWWPLALGLSDDVDPSLLFCKLYQRSLTRTSEK